MEKVEKSAKPKDEKDGEKEKKEDGKDKEKKKTSNLKITEWRYSEFLGEKIPLT